MKGGLATLVSYFERPEAGFLERLINYLGSKPLNHRRDAVLMLLKQENEALIGTDAVGLPMDNTIHENLAYSYPYP